MKLETVHIDDVYPNENSPRKTFEGIDELAASFDLNEDRPGEPFIPPILVRDGGIYHIVDGERRYRALKKRKTQKFAANVCEDFDEANTLVASLATDDKQPLSEMEKSHGVQQMLLLGIDPIAVDKAVRRTDSKRIKKALDMVDDAAEDMTIDRLLAIEELHDYPDAVQKLTYCNENEWRHIYHQSTIKIKNEKSWKELTEKLQEKGYTVVKSRNDIEEDISGKLRHRDTVRNAEDVEQLDISPDESYCVYTYGGYIDIFRIASDDETTPQVNQKERDRKIIYEAVNKSSMGIQRWVSTQLSLNAPLAHTKQLLHDVVWEMQCERILADILNELDIEPNNTVDRLTIIQGLGEILQNIDLYVGWLVLDGHNKMPRAEQGLWREIGLLLGAVPLLEDTVDRYVALMDALKHDGYVLSDTDQSVLDGIAQAATLNK